MFIFQMERRWIDRNRMGGQKGRKDRKEGGQEEDEKGRREGGGKKFKLEVRYFGDISQL